MELTKVEKNKALVLKAFETLFNERDYAAGERDLLHLEFHASKARDEVAPKLSGWPSPPQSKFTGKAL